MFIPNDEVRGPKIAFALGTIHPIRRTPLPLVLDVLSAHCDEAKRNRSVPICPAESSAEHRPHLYTSPFGGVALAELRVCCNELYVFRCPLLYRRNHGFAQAVHTILKDRVLLVIRSSSDFLL